MVQPALMKPDQIVACVERFFGEPISRMTAPGGKSRASYRVYFESRTIIVSQRPDAARRAREAYVLEHLNGRCGAAPAFLGARDGLVFQSDAGAQRLNHAIHTCPRGERGALAAKAVAAIFDIHRSARRAGLVALPGPDPVRLAEDDVIAGVGRFAQNLGQTLAGFDPATLAPEFRAPPHQLIKWDCRAGNAALDGAGALRWFDFEDARIAHGPEDFAWLIADETWPVGAGEMLALVRAGLTPDDSADIDGYMRYLEQYTALHALRRIRLIMREARRSGWLGRVSLLKYDNVGVDPFMGERLCGIASDLAARHPATAPLAVLCEAAAGAFRAARSAGKPSP